MKKLFLTPALALALTSLIGVDSIARPNAPNPNGGGNNNSGSPFGKFQSVCIQGTSKAELDINNVRAMVLNGGDMWWDLTDPRYEVPKVEDPSAIKKHSLFAGAVWIGGRDQANQLYLAAQTYRQQGDQGFWPGPLTQNGTISDPTCGIFDFHAKVDGIAVRDFEQFASTAALPIPEESIPQAIKNWPGLGNPFRPNLQGLAGGNLAPFEDVDGNGIYDPRGGDYPKIKGDQSIWWVMNDAGGIKQPTSPTIGLELQVQAFAFQTGNLINNMTFYEQTLINRGNIVLNDTYVAQWVDPDLGNYLDDYVGCDVGRGLGYVYNGDDLDEGVSGYGVNPPALGVDFFSGPRSDANDGLDNDRDGIIDNMVTVVDCETGVESIVTEEIIMSNFMYYDNDFTVKGNPEEDEHYYNYMSSRWKDGALVYYGGDGRTQVQGSPAVQYKFMFPGNTDPLGYGYHTAQNVAPGTGYTPNAIPGFDWTERTAGNTPADRRFLQSAGPFTLSPGQVIPLTIGVLWVRAGRGGAEGSLGQLLVADDAAQTLFNNCFELPKGPNAPDLAITELDQELIVSIIPDEFNLNGRLINTEEYVEFDRTLSQNAQVEDPYYRFQGYVVYQLKHPNVSAAQLNNPDLARVVQAENGFGQSDINDDLSLLVNREFNSELGEYTSVPMINGENQGIRHTLRIQRDMFAQGEARLSNFKAYHYMAIAYASNPTNNVNVLNTFTQYRQGFENVRVYTAYPHKVAPESGMTLNASSGQGLEVTRLYGVGNGGNVLDIDSTEENNIVRNISEPELTYVGSGSPVAVTIYDPKRVARADFNLKLSSRLTFFVDSTSGIGFDADGNFFGLAVGDTILAGPLPTVPSPSFLSNYAQTPGRAVINRIISTGPAADDEQARPIVVLDLEMLNDENGGTFEAEIDLYQSVFDAGLNQYVSQHLGYTTVPLTFSTPNGAVAGTTVEFGLHDFWRLNITPEGQPTSTIYSDRTLSDFNEQLLPEYGLAIHMRGARNPGYRVVIERENQIQEGTMTFNGAEWFTGVDPEVVSWQAANEVLDPGGAFTRVANGAWTPYALTSEGRVGGPRYRFLAAGQRLSTLPNVNIVLTSDRSKWTRSVVLQAELLETCEMDSSSIGIPVDVQRLLKSTVASVDENGATTGEQATYTGNGVMPSTGLGWFPGYAVDIDRGVRLNIMFSESRVNRATGEPRTNGNDLMWDPTSEDNGGLSAIYVMNSVYDEGKKIEAQFDSIMTNTAYISTSPVQEGCLAKNPNGFGNAIQTIFNDVNWVGNLRLTEDATKLASQARVRLRVNRQYNSYTPPGAEPVSNNNPEYAFNTFSTAVSTGNVAVATSALDLVRVVPNPYYAYSDYEQRVTDNIVKITNLPPQATISIFNMNGTLVQSIRKEDPNRTFVEWNLKNRENLAIASGVYIIHVKAELRDASGGITEEEKVVKFFAILRPIDLQSF